MVRGRARSPKIGLFQAGTHRIVDVPHCAVHHPLVNEVAAVVRRAVRETGVPPYADRPHVGLLRAVQVVVERTSGGAQVVLVSRDETPDALDGLLARVRAELGDRLHSLWWNGNPARTNTILGPHWRRVCGDEMVCERVAGARVFYPPGAFGQSHLALADRLAARVAARVPEGARLVEFYAGCGALGLAGLARAGHVTFNEREPASLAGLRHGIDELVPDLRRRVSLVPGAAGDCARIASDADLVLVDPPRRGLDAGLLEALCRVPPPGLVYVSCDVDSFVRDADALVAAGLRPVELGLFDLFPFTEHVETLARFERG